MLEFYQHLPENINPIIFSIGFFSLRWYPLMYLLGLAVVYLLLRWRIKSENIDGYELSDIINFIFYSFVGLLIGARLGYVFFYKFSYFAKNPLAIISPYNFSSGEFTGIFGMSFFGGLLGIIVVALIFTKKIKVNFWKWADFIVPAIPAGYFFGRIGNFLNGELYGNVTTRFWGMYFPNDNLGLLRHPSQLYEAFFEGFILFLILWNIRNKSKFTGYLFLIFLFGYAFFRFFIEFFRQPDPQIDLILNFLTLGQFFSLVLVFIVIAIFISKKNVKNLR